MTIRHDAVGTVTGLWRYPVKSMQGEAISAALVTERGFLGDRAYAVREVATGHIASAKHPRKWERLFQCRAAFAYEPQQAEPLPPLTITLPDGVEICSTYPDVDSILSGALGREVSLVSDAPLASTREANRTSVDNLDGEEIIREEPLARAAPPGTFFDYAPLHLLTSTSLRHLGELYPEGMFAASRFRPNVLIDYTGSGTTLPENEWPGTVLCTERGLGIDIIDPAPRCVVTTLAHGPVPGDREILRTIARSSAAVSATLAPGTVFRAVVGVYGVARQGGVISLGDGVYLAGRDDE